MKKDVLILGVGNLLLGDEGVGVHVAQQLLQLPLPGNVEVLDGGTVGYELLPYLEGKAQVILVDAVHADCEPGTLLRFDEADAELQWPLSYSSHQSGLRELLNGAKMLVPPPEIVVYGIVPRDMYRLTIGLSREVHRRIPAILSVIMDEIQSPSRKTGAVP